jgi:hypothetical protein
MTLVRLGAVNPAITTSWRFEVLIFSQLSVRAARRVLAVGALRHNALKASALRFREELRAACLTMAAERDELVARQDFLEALLACEQRETA